MEQTLKYFREAERLIEANEFEDEESFHLFINNVFVEVEGLEYRLACSHDGSTILEKVLRHARPFHLRVFFEKVRGKWLEMCRHRYASHVVESWCRQAVVNAGRVVEVLEGEEAVSDLPQLDSQLEDVAGFVLEDVVGLIEDSYGTHIVRLLLRMWNGELDGQPIKYVPGTELFLRLVQTLLALPREVFDFKKEIIHQQASPVLQYIVSRLCRINMSHLLQKVLISLFPSVFSMTGTDEDLQKERQLFSKVADNVAGSRFFESLIAALDASQFLLFFNKLVRPEVGRLVDGTNSNFVLQHVFSNCPNVNQFQMILESLRPVAAELMGKRRHGLLMRLAQWVVEHELAAADETLGIIYDAFHLKDAQDRKRAFVAIARLQEKEVLDESRPLVAGGCSLLQLLTHFPATSAKPIIDGFLDYPVASLVAMACHPNGSRVVEAALLSRTVSAAAKQRTLRKLRDHMDTLAGDKSGSHVVDRCWTLATSEMREAMAARLLSVKTRLQDTPHGRLVLRNCRVEEFARSQEQWKQAEEGAERRRTMFADLLEDTSNDLLPEHLKVEAGRKSDKRTKRHHGADPIDLLPKALVSKKKKSK